MRRQGESTFACPKVAPLLKWVVPAACACLHACVTEVGVFQARDVGGAGAVAAAVDAATSSSTSTSSTSPTVLIEPGKPAPTSDGTCQPGHYVGVFNGTYNSAAWSNGTMPLTIAATPSMDRPGLEFWLEAIPRNCRSDQEFCADFTVRGGKIRGYANPFSDGNASSDGNNNDGIVLAIRFEIDFGGTLDCSRGQFRGLLENGCYDVATVLFYFNGVAPATYDPVTTSFTNGGWMVKEMPSANAWFPPDANIGGMGSWEASLVNDTVGPVAQGGGLCDMK